MAEDPTTWSELKTSARSWMAEISTDSLSENRLEECIAFAERHFNRSVFVPDRESALTITADAQVEALPSDFWGFKSPPYIDGSPDVVLQKLTPADLRATYPDATTGTPAHYAIEGENILFGPTPSSAQTIKGTYYSVISPLNSGTSTNWLLTDHPDLYLVGTLYFCHLFLMDEKRALLFKTQLDQYVADINKSGSRRSNSGPLTSTHSVRHIPNIRA
jgi:hypothetical protein